MNQPAQSELKETLDHLVVLELSQCEYRWEPDVWQTLRRDIHLVCAVLKKALEQAPPSTLKLLQGAQIVAAIGKMPELRTLDQEIERLNDLLNNLAQAESAVRDTIKSRTRAIMGKVSGEIQRLWSRLHPDEPVEEVELYIPGDAEKAIDICLKFYVVDQPSPRLTLSEGHRNSLGLCIFLALVSLEGDLERPVILDDVVSSLDREYRSRLARVLQEDFAGRQVILLTHDREWYTELRTRLPGKGWGFLPCARGKTRSWEYNCRDPRTLSMTPGA